MQEREPLIISGPSGIGKTTLSNQLEQHNFRNVLKTTTRLPRINEIDGIDYEFIDKDNFLKEMQNGEFIIADQIYGNYYGARKNQLHQARSKGEVPMLQLHTSTIERVTKNLPNAETIFMKPINLDFLAARLNLRIQSKEEYVYRLEQGIQELDIYHSTYHSFYKHEIIIYSNDNTKHIKRIKNIYERPHNIEKN